MITAMKNKFSSKKKKSVEKYTKAPSLVVGQVFDIIVSSFDLTNSSYMNAMESEDCFADHKYEYYIVRDTTKALSIIEGNGAFKFTATTGLLKHILGCLRNTSMNRNSPLFHNWSKCNNDYNEEIQISCKFSNQEHSNIEYDQKTSLAYSFRTASEKNELMIGSALLDMLFYMHEGNHICVGAVTSLQYHDTYRRMRRAYGDKLTSCIPVTISQRLEPTSLMVEILNYEIPVERYPHHNNPEQANFESKLNRQSDELFKHTDLVNNSKSILSSLISVKSVCKMINLIDEMSVRNLLEVGVTPK
mgnify:CR=1 FL=1